MFTAVLVLIVILAILLILLVLIQNSKGGLGAAMGSASSQIIGVKKTTDILEKFTWGLAISIMILCLASNFVLEKSDASTEEEVSTVNIDKAQENPGAQPAPAKTPTTSDSGK